VTDKTIAAALIHGLSWDYVDERSLQGAIDDELGKLGVSFERETSLCREDRPDFLVDESIAVEVKVDGSKHAALSQVLRYAEHAKVRELVIVTTLNKHRGMPATVNGKALHIAYVGRPF